MRAENWRHRLPLLGSVVAAILLPFCVSLAGRDDGSAREPTPVAWPARAAIAAPAAPPREEPPAIPFAAPEAAHSLAQPPPAVDGVAPEGAAAPAGGSGSGAEALAHAAAHDFDCLIEPHVLVNLGSPVEGLIERIHVDRSDPVEEGQVLVELEAGVERATVDLARARAEMTAELRARETAAAREQRRKHRMDNLYEREATSLELQDRVGTEARVAELDLEQARERRTLASLELDQALEVLKRRTVRSPIRGYVVERRMSPGEKVDDQTILTLAQVDPLRVEVILPSSLFGQIAVGAKAEVRSELPASLPYTAEVSRVDRVIDAATGTFGVRLTLPNPGNEIPGGLRCRLRFLHDAAP